MATFIFHIPSSARLITIIQGLSWIWLKLVSCGVLWFDHLSKLSWFAIKMSNFFTLLVLYCYKLSYSLVVVTCARKLKLIVRVRSLAMCRRELFAGIFHRMSEVSVKWTEVVQMSQNWPTSPLQSCESWISSERKPRLKKIYLIQIWKPF